MFTLSIFSVLFNTFLIALIALWSVFVYFGSLFYVKLVYLYVNKFLLHPFGITWHTQAPPTQCLPRLSSVMRTGRDSCFLLTIHFQYVSAWLQSVMFAESFYLKGKKETKFSICCELQQSRNPFFFSVTRESNRFYLLDSELQPETIDSYPSSFKSGVNQN